MDGNPPYQPQKLYVSLTGIGAKQLRGWSEGSRIYCGVINLCVYSSSLPPFFPHGLTLSLWLPAIPSFKLFNGLVLQQTPMLERFFIVSVISLHCLGNNFENDFSCGRCSLCLCPLDSHKETAAKRFLRWKQNEAGASRA